MSKNVLVKQSGPTVFQNVGPTGTRPSFLDFARNTFGQRGQGITPGQRARGLVGMAGQAAAAGVTALNTADSLQQGNVSAPLQAGISYQGYDPTATIDPNVGNKINQNAQFQNPTPTYDYTQSTYPIHQFVQNPGVSPAGVAVQQPQQLQQPQQQVGYGAGLPTLGQAQAQQAQQPQQQPVQPQQQQPVQPQEIQPRQLDTNTKAPVAISTSTEPPVPMGSAQADAMNTTQTATPNDGRLDQVAMMGSGGFVPTQANLMDRRTRELYRNAPPHVQQPIQQPPQETIQQQTDNIDPATRAYLESIRGEDVKPLGVQKVAGGGQGFQSLDFSTADGAGQAYNRGIGVNNTPFMREVTLPNGTKIQVSSDQLIRRSEFTDMLFDLLGPDNLYKMTPNEIGELAAFMYIKTR